MKFDSKIFNMNFQLNIKINDRTVHKNLFLSLYIIIINSELLCIELKNVFKHKDNKNRNMRTKDIIFKNKKIYARNIQQSILHFHNNSK